MSKDRHLAAITGLMVLSCGNGASQTPNPRLPGNPECVGLIQKAMAQVAMGHLPEPANFRDPVFTDASEPPDAWPVHIDPAQLSSAIANLATNARDAMPNGGRLTIETKNSHLDADYAAVNPEVIPGDFVLLEVSDT